MNIDTLILAHTAMIINEMDSKLETVNPEIHNEVSLHLAYVGVCDMFYNVITDKMIMNPNTLGGYNEKEITEYLNKINNIN